MKPRGNRLDSASLASNWSVDILIQDVVEIHLIDRKNAFSAGSHNAVLQLACTLFLSNALCFLLRGMCNMKPVRHVLFKQQSNSNRIYSIQNTRTIHNYSVVFSSFLKVETLIRSPESHSWLGCHFMSRSPFLWLRLDVFEFLSVRTQDKLL